MNNGLNKQLNISIFPVNNVNQNFYNFQPNVCICLCPKLLTQLVHVCAVSMTPNYLIHHSKQVTIYEIVKWIAEIKAYQLSCNCNAY